MDRFIIILHGNWNPPWPRPAGMVKRSARCRAGAAAAELRVDPLQRQPLRHAAGQPGMFIWELGTSLA